MVSVTTFTQLPKKRGSSESGSTSISGTEKVRCSPGYRASGTSADLSRAQTSLRMSKRPCPETGTGRKGKGALPDGSTGRRRRPSPYPPPPRCLTSLDVTHGIQEVFFLVAGNSAHPLLTVTLQTSWQRDSCSESSFSSCVLLRCSAGWRQTCLLTPLDATQCCP